MKLFLLAVLIFSTRAADLAKEEAEVAVPLAKEVSKDALPAPVASLGKAEPAAAKKAAPFVAQARKLDEDTYDPDAGSYHDPSEYSDEVIYENPDALTTEEEQAATTGTVPASQPEAPEELYSPTLNTLALGQFNPYLQDALQNTPVTTCLVELIKLDLDDAIYFHTELLELLNIYENQAVESDVYSEPEPELEYDDSQFQVSAGGAEGEEQITEENGPVEVVNGTDQGEGQMEPPAETNVTTTEYVDDNPDNDYYKEYGGEGSDRRKRFRYARLRNAGPVRRFVHRGVVGANNNQHRLAGRVVRAQGSSAGNRLVRRPYGHAII